MDNELDLLLGTAIDSLVKLDLLLYLHARPGIVQKPEDIAGPLRRAGDEIIQALEGLSEAGLIDRFPLGSGRHVVYGPTEDEHVRELIAVIYDRYHRDPESRAQLVRVITRPRETDPSPRRADP
ncbi:MAG TPA: hypothetical protein VMY87_05675 [Armatimonadota bacterium]|nr:hypothetical protein [Armatimonadota bacterium]